MKRFCWLLGAALFFAACGTTGPVFPVEDELYDWVTSQQSVDQASDQAPVVADSVVTFRLAPGQRRSALETGEDWRIGQAYLFGFDVRLDPETLGPGAIAISRLSRVTVPENEIVSVLLDRKRGVSVFGRTCIAPDQLSEWHRIEMRMRLANDDTGFLEVFCDRKPVWAQNDIRTTFKPVCRLQEGCDADIAKPARFEWLTGLLAERSVTRRTEIQMQRLHQRVIFYIPNRVGTL